MKALTERMAKFGLKLYLYLNEPRSMPISFFEKHPGLKGAVHGDYASLCTSVPEVQRYIKDAVATITRSKTVQTAILIMKTVRPTAPAAGVGSEPMYSHRSTHSSAKESRRLIPR